MTDRQWEWVTSNNDGAMDMTEEAVIENMRLVAADPSNWWLVFDEPDAKLIYRYNPRWEEGYFGLFRVKE